MLFGAEECLRGHPFASGYAIIGNGTARWSLPLLCRHEGATATVFLPLCTLGAVGALAACTSQSEAEPEAKPTGQVQESLVQALDARGVDLDNQAACDFTRWYCSNLTAPIEDIEERARAAGATEANQAEVIQSATIACRSTGTPTGG